jgi:hypothetical protein
MIVGSRSTAVLLACCLLASPALADKESREPKAPKAVSDQDRQVASDLVKKAIARSGAGDHSAAIDIYVQAYTLVPNSILLSDIGSEFQQMGKQREALRYFCMYLAKDPTGTNATYASTQAKAMHALISKKHNDDDDDDDDVCAPPRKHPTPETTDHGKPSPTTATQPIDDPAAPAAREDDTTMRYAGIGLGAAGVVGVGIGIYGGIEAKNISDEITNHPKGTPWPNGIQSVQRRGQNYEYLQIGGLVGGGVLAGVGLVLFLRSAGAGDPVDKASKPDKPDKGDRTVHVTPTSNGFAVYGRF